MKKLISILLITIMIFSSLSIAAFAEEAEVYEIGGMEVGVVQADGSILVTTTEYGKALNLLLGDNKKRVVTLPKKKIYLDRLIWVGSNKTINAKGATIIQHTDMPLIAHNCTKTDYKSLKNFTINGGTWTFKDISKAKKATSLLRFNHAKNITIKNATIDTNYVCHAVELIACKDVKITNCKMVAKGKQKNDKYAEPLQIDIATKATAPSCAEYGKKFVQGQTCKNITVKNCTIKGSRGICTNKTDTEGGKWLKKHHVNVTITGCTVTGMATEALCLHNVAGVTVKNNKVYSKGSDDNYNNGIYLASFGSFKNLSSYKNVFSGNTVKGGKRAIYIATYRGGTYKIEKSHQFGATTIKKNKLYAKSGAANALTAVGCKSVSKSGNKLYRW